MRGLLSGSLVVSLAACGGGDGEFWTYEAATGLYAGASQCECSAEVGLAIGGPDTPVITLICDANTGSRASRPTIVFPLPRKWNQRQREAGALTYTVTTTDGEASPSVNEFGASATLTFGEKVERKIGNSIDSLRAVYFHTVAAPQVVACPLRIGTPYPATECAQAPAGTFSELKMLCRSVSEENDPHAFDAFQENTP